MIQNVVIDFDGTVANTLKPNPKGVGVNEGYEYAIGKIFGREGLAAYEEIGKLQNRAPTELIEALLKDDKDALLFKKANRFFCQNRKVLENLVPEGKGFLLEWPEKTTGLDTVTLRTISEMVVRIKLSFLMKEIGTMQENGKTWPEPCRGFIDFFELIHEMNSKKENAFRIAILSSGHEYFIEKVFRSWGISPLPSMLTDDDLRDSSLKEIIAKPSASLFCLLEQKLKKDKGENGELNKTNTIYIGDDPEKDGKLAKNRGIPFMLFCGNSENPKDDCRYFNDWSEIITLLKNNKHQDNA